MLKFREITPSMALQPYVHSFWTLEESLPENSSRVLRFIPDGYVEWMFHFNHPPDYQFRNQTKISGNKNHTVGQFFGRLDVHFPDPPFRLFAIKFHPWSAHLFCEYSMKELSQGIVNLEELTKVKNWGLVEKLVECDSLEACKAVAETFLLNIIPGTEIAPIRDMYKTFQFALEIPFQDLKDSFNFSQRRLEQLFAEQIGISPRKTHHLFKIRQATKMITSASFRSLTEVGYKLGFYDQAHFTHQFKSFTGYTPRQFLKENVSDSGLLYF